MQQYLKGWFSVKSSSHFILIDVRVSTQTTLSRQHILMSVCCLRLGKILLLDRCFHPSPNISWSIILIYTLFYYYKCGHRNVLSKRQVSMSIFHIINFKKKFMDTGVLDFFNKKLTLCFYFKFSS